MLDRRGLLDAPGLRVDAVRCHGGPSWSPEEPVSRPAIVLVRRGVFRRRVRGAEAVMDTTMGYVQLPGEWQQVSHPAGGDVCTTIAVSPEVASQVAWAGPVVVSPAVDLAHRRLFAGASDRRGLATDLLAALLPPPRGVSHRAVDEVRVALHTDPDLDLDDLAALAGWSPWYLSRAFHRVTGSTISEYRRRLRVRAALDAMAESGRPLAELALEAGFADQAHLTRAMRREVELTPAAVRRILR